MPFQIHWAAPQAADMLLSLGFDGVGLSTTGAADGPPWRLLRGAPPVVAGALLALRRDAVAHRTRWRYAVAVPLIVRDTDAAAQTAAAMRVMAADDLPLVGSPSSVAQVLLRYADLGVTGFVFSGTLEDAHRCAEHLLPLLPGRHAVTPGFVDSPFNSPSYVAEAHAPALW